MKATIDTRVWERSSTENWASPSSTSLDMLVNLNHDYIVSDISLANYTLSSVVTTKSGDDDGIGVVFDYIDALNYKYIMYSGGGLRGINNSLYGDNAPVSLIEVKNGTHKVLSKNKDFHFWARNSTFEIKLENVFDDIVFYVDGIKAINYKKDKFIDGKIGFVTISQIASFKNIQLFQTSANRIKAKYKLYAIDNSDVLTEITPRLPKDSDKNTEIVAKAYGEVSKPVELEIKHRGNSNILTEIQPVGHYNMDTEIEVRPHNQMTAIYEVQRPPIITTIFNPTQDSFTREKSEYSTINYGSSASMVVGRYGGDIWRSFVKFELSEFNASFILTESVLRLYYKGSIPKNLQLELFSTDDRWYEYSITSLNRPTPIALISNEFKIDEARGFVEFDVMDIVKSWLAKNQENNGFIIRVANESQDGQTTFYTRETALAPELVVRYFDSTVFSQGRTQVKTEIDVMRASSKNIATEVEVHSLYEFERIDTEIYVHRAEVPLDSDILTEIVATCVSNEVTFVVAINKDLDVNTEISSRIGFFDSIDTEFYVSRQIVPIEVFSKYGSVKNTEIAVRRYENCDLYTEISPSRSTVYSEVFAKYSSSTNFEITVQRHESADVLTSIVAKRDVVKSEIYVKFLDKTDLEITVQKEVVLDIPTVITAKRDVVKSEIYVKHRNDMLTELSARATDNSTSLIEIYSSRQIVPVEIFSKYKNEKNTEIGIRGYATSDPLTEIAPSRQAILTEIRAVIRGEEDVLTAIAKTRPAINTEITVSQVCIGTSVSARKPKDSDLYTEISVTIPRVNVEVFVKYRSEVLTEITPNIKSDIKTEIIANKGKVVTAITPRVPDENDLFTDISARIPDESIIFIDIEFKAVNQVPTEIFARSVSQLNTELVHSKDSVVTSIVIPTWVDLDIKTEIQPRIFMVNNVLTRIQVGSAGGAYAFII